MGNHTTPKLQEKLNLTEGKGSIDAIFAINLIKEANSHLPLYTATVDLSKASTEINSGSNYKN
jgi:hypothetical protein